LISSDFPPLFLATFHAGYFNSSFTQHNTAQNSTTQHNSTHHIKGSITLHSKQFFCHVFAYDDDGNGGFMYKYKYKYIHKVNILLLLLLLLLSSSSATLLQISRFLYSCCYSTAASNVSSSSSFDIENQINNKNVMDFHNDNFLFCKNKHQHQNVHNEGAKVKLSPATRHWIYIISHKWANKWMNDWVSEREKVKCVEGHQNYVYTLSAVNDVKNIIISISFQHCHHFFCYFAQTGLCVRCEW
jgi:hypothetical protein